MSAMVLQGASATAQTIRFEPGSIRRTNPAQSPSTRPGDFSAGIGSGGVAIPDATLLELGMGYDSLSGEIIPNVCVAANGAELQFGANELGPTYNHEFINWVTDMAESDSASGTDAGFSFTYKLISVGFQTGSNSSSLFNSVDSYGRVYKRIITTGMARDNGRWSPIGADAIKRPLRQFTDRCGTHYIRAIYYGSLLDQTLRFKLQSTKRTNENKNDLSFGVTKLFGFNYSDTSSQTAVNARSSATAIDESRGVTNVIPVSDGVSVQTLVKFARETFPTNVLAGGPGKGAVLFIEVVPYYRLAASGASSIPRWPDAIQGAVANKATLYKQLLSALSDVEYALALPTDDAALKELYADDRTALEKKQQLGFDIQAKLRTAALNCRGLLEKAVDDATGRAKCAADLDAAMTPAGVAAVRPVAR